MNGGTSLTIGANNRLAFDGTFTYEYDAEGNLIHRYKDNDTSWTLSSGDTDVTDYTWDYRNRLLSATDYATYGSSSTQAVIYIYDPFNQLVRRASFVGSTFSDTFFVLDQGQVALQFDRDDFNNVGAGDLSHRYLWGPAVDQLLADEQVDWSDSDADGEVLWALTDNLGSVRDMVDNNGTLRLHRAFDAFGKVTDEDHYDAGGDPVSSGTGYIDEAFAFTGRWFDAATGLQNNLNRWYDPSIGRWLSEDPIGFAGDPSNLYRPMGNAPTMYVDPSGLWRWFGWFRGPEAPAKEWGEAMLPHRIDGTMDALKTPAPLGPFCEALEAEQGLYDVAAGAKAKQALPGRGEGNGHATDREIQKAYDEWQEISNIINEHQKDHCP